MTTATTVLGLLPMALGLGEGRRAPSPARDHGDLGASPGHPTHAHRGAGHLHAAHSGFRNPDESRGRRPASGWRSAAPPRPKAREATDMWLTRLLHAPARHAGDGAGVGDDPRHHLVLQAPAGFPARRSSSRSSACGSPTPAASRARSSARSPARSRRSSPPSAACARSRAVATKARRGSTWSSTGGRDVNVLRMEVQEKIDQIRGDLPADIDRHLSLHVQLERHPHHRRTHLGEGARPLGELRPDRAEDHHAAPADSGRGPGRDRRREPHHRRGLPEARQDPGVQRRRGSGSSTSSRPPTSISPWAHHGPGSALRPYARSAASGACGARQSFPIDERGLRLKDIAELVYAAPAPPTDAT